LSEYGIIVAILAYAVLIDSVPRYSVMSALRESRNAFLTARCTTASWRSIRWWLARDKVAGRGEVRYRSAAPITINE